VSAREDERSRRKPKVHVARAPYIGANKRRSASSDALRLQLTAWLYHVKGLSEVELDVLSVLCEEALDHTGDDIPPYECVMRMATLATLSGITEAEARIVAARLVAAGHIKLESRSVPDERYVEVFPGCDFRRTRRPAERER
jgi:hypothetical protein